MNIKQGLALATVCLLSVLVPASADEATPAPDVLYDEGLTALTAAGQALDALDATAAPGRLDVYIGQASSSRWSLLSAQWQLDGQAMPERLLAPAVSAGLAAQGDRIRIERLPAAVATRTISIEFVVADKARPAIEPQHVSRSVEVEPATQDRALEFVVHGGLVGKPGIELALRTADMVQPDARFKLFGLKLGKLPLPGSAATSYQPGSDADPALRQARYWRHNADSERADRELLAIAARAGSEQAMPAAWWLERMRVATALGRLDRAAEYGGQIAAAGALAPELAVERLALIEAHLAVGDVDTAEQLLPLAWPKLPLSSQQDWQHLQGRVLLARQRNAEAVAALDGGNQTDDAYRYMQQSNEAVRANAYRRYNLAVAMLRNGDEARGLSWLDLLGRMQSNDPETVALRDKANLSLGWHFLRAEQGRSALGVLGRIPVDGPQADRALLGMGWALLAPNGQRQSRVDLDLDRAGTSRRSTLPAPLQVSLLRLRALEPELNGAIAPSSIERDTAPKKRDDALRAAIRVWQPLLSRDEHSTSVLEGMLAIGYAQDQLLDPAAARSSYDQAVTAMRRIEDVLAIQSALIAEGALRERVNGVSDSGDLYQQMDRLHLPFDERSAALYSLLREQSRWQKLEASLQSAAGRLAAAQTTAEPVPVDPTLLARIGEQREQQMKQAEAEAMRLLDSQAADLRRYRAAALLALARLEDNPGLAERGSLDCKRGCR